MSGGPTGTYVVPAGIDQIKHVVVIMQENRSFDSYFGTFPGADGIPMSNGTSSVCVVDPATGTCVAPFPDHADVNGGGPRHCANATSDIDGGEMDGFIGQAESGKHGCADPTDQACMSAAQPDVMSYHTGSDISHYWTYAKDFRAPGRSRRRSASDGSAARGNRGARGARPLSAPVATCAA